MAKNNVPLSQTQSGIYFESVKMGDGTYDLHFLYTLDNSIDMERLARSIEKVVQAHPSMEVRIKEDLTQFIPDVSQNPYKQSVLRISEKEWQKLLTRLIAEPLRLIDGRLFRFDLVETEKAKYMLRITHHVAFDGSSFNVIMEEISAAYNGEELTQETYNALDVADEELKLRKTEVYQNAKEWYEKNFSGLDVDSLPTADLNNADSRDFLIHSISINCSELKNFCREKKISTSSLTSGAFAVLMGVYTNQQEALFSTIYHGRNEKTKNLIGMFVKTLPVYGKWNNEENVDDFLKGLSQQIQGSRNNDIFSFADVNTICPMNDKPFFVWHGNIIRTRLEICGKPVHEEILDKKCSNAPLSFELMAVPSGLSLRIEYNSGKYTHEFIELLAKTYENILRQLMTKEYVREIEPCPKGSEELKLLDSFNNTDVPYDDTQTVVSLFNKAAAKYPNNTAVVFNDRRYTYSEVDLISDKIAGYLSSLGLGRGDVVSVLIHRGEYMVIASLGILKAGCAYQPLDSTYPSERLNFMVKDSKAKVLITTEELRPLLSDYNNEILFLKDIPALPMLSTSLPQIKPEDLFILLYTSGSTGTPKGVRLTHANLVCYIAWHIKNENITEKSKIAEYASYGFDAHMVGIYPTITTGAEVHIIDESIRLDFSAIQKYFDTFGITSACMTTQVGRQFAEYYTGNSLKYLFVGGEKLAPVSIENKSFIFINGYGPTECTICSTTHPVENKEKNIPIGKPLDNLKLYIVNSAGHRVPVGALGELWISGPQVGDGYLNLPEKTAEVFIDNPFDSSKPHVYKTGDIVRYRRDGNIEFIGRRDAQVKIRGFRIELTEIEAVIREFPSVKDVTVQAFDNPDGSGKYIAAYVVSDEKIDINALNNFILERKPSYMVPAATMQIEKIPLNQNQKVNKRELPEPVFANQQEEGENEITREKTKFEEEILAVVQKVIGDVNVNVSSSLISCGLTSINSIRLVLMLAERFNVEIPVQKLLSGASIIDIENLIFEEWEKQKFFRLPESQTSENISEIRTDYPLSAVQLGVYYDAMKRPDDILYNIPLCLAFEKIDVSKFIEAIKKTVAAHSYINTHVEVKNGELVQVRNDSEIPNVVYTELAEDKFLSYKEHFIRSFNLRNWPLYRFEIVKTEKRTYFLMDIHHIIFDGMSLRIFLKDLGIAYSGQELKPESCSYFDYTENEEKQKITDSYAEAEKFFDDMFSKYDSSSEIPADKAGLIEEGRFGESSVKINKTSIESLCSKINVTPASFFLSALFVAVSRFANTKDVYISTIDSGRNSLNTMNTLGMFVHTLPLSMDLKPDLTSEELILKSNDVLRGSVANEIFPFTQISAKYGYQTNIMYECQLGVVSTENSIGGVPFEKIETHLEVPKFKIAIIITEENNSYVVSVRYNDAIYTEGYMKTLANSLKNIAESFINDKSEKVRDISLLNNDEKKLIEAFKTSATHEIPCKLLHKMFEASAENTPDKIALIASDKTLTFKELNESANVIAHNLIKRGLKQKGCAVLLLPRRSFYFSALFGVLKAGAAFIPCDPEYPKDRINLIINDSDAQFIITTQEHSKDYPSEKVILIDDLLYGNENKNPDVEVSPEDLAYMIYTSGSTGRPKGVMLKHSGICNFCTQHPANILYEVVKDKISAMIDITTVSFDLSLKDTLGILVNAKTVVFANEEQMNDPRAIVKLFEQTHADAINATPSRYLQYFEYEPFIDALAKCHLVMAGGEVFPKTLLEKLQKITSAKIINTYGPTETTISANMAELTNAKNISVGHPLLNVHEYIVDSDGNPVPVGVIGELLIGGAGVGKGYKNLPELTQKSFVEYNGERVYRSGDYAKWDEAGNVIILGRKDNQVKLRGLRIELSEIEGLIEKQPDIKKAVVIIRKLSGQDNLCAYFTADKQINIAALRDELKKHLTNYMIPTAYLQLEKIPVTPNGKIDIKNLPEPVAVKNSEYVAPSNDVEKFFCEAFAKTLNIEKIGVNDDFFELGGTSLVVTGVVIAAQENGYSLNYGDVFKYTTPRALSALFTKDNSQIQAEISVFDNYDYTKINSILEKNTLEAFQNGKQREIGNILLTGATGFMGIHVLAEFLRSENGIAYCLVRKGKFQSSQKRLINTLHYYFENEFENISERLQVFDGDVTNYESFEKLEKLDINTVFNCAASVRHFSSGTDIEDINVKGVDNCIRFCEKNGARLIHFSTTSVAGTMIIGSKNDVKYLDERHMYFGQILDNQYTSSKMLAERDVMEAISEKGLDAKIIRVGTLASREKDGEFQMNFLTNSFMGRLRSYMILKAFPYSMANYELRMGPIDTSAKAFLLLAKTPKECCLFNAANVYTVPLISLIQVMREIGLEIKLVDDIEFNSILSEAEKNPKKAAILQSILAYKSIRGNVQLIPVKSRCEYTSQILMRMGFFWHETGHEYIYKFVNALSGLGFFDEEFLNR